MAHSNIKKSGRKRDTNRRVVEGEAHEIGGKLGAYGILQVKIFKKIVHTQTHREEGPTSADRSDMMATENN